MGINLDGPRNPITLHDPELLPLLAPFASMPKTAEAVREFERCAGLLAEAQTKLSWLESERCIAEAAARDRRELGAALSEGRPATEPLHTKKLAAETEAARLAVAALRDVRVASYDAAIAAVASVSAEVADTASRARADAAAKIADLSREILATLAEVDRAQSDLGVVTSIFNRGEVSVKGMRFASATTITAPAYVFEHTAGEVKVNASVILSALVDGLPDSGAPVVDDDEDEDGPIDLSDEGALMDLAVLPAGASI